MESVSLRDIRQSHLASVAPMNPKGKARGRFLGRRVGYFENVVALLYRPKGAGNDRTTGCVCSIPIASTKPQLDSTDLMRGSGDLKSCPRTESAGGTALSIERALDREEATRLEGVRGQRHMTLHVQDRYVTIDAVGSDPRGHFPVQAAIEDTGRWPSEDLKSDAPGVRQRRMRFGTLSGTVHWPFHKSEQDGAESDR
jgi:hypothetical protein